MATEKRLIDANALIKDWNELTKRMVRDADGKIPVDFGLVIRELSKTPTVDAVEVVRCEDCKYRVLDIICGEDWCNHTLGLCSEVYATDFCCHGERKDND